MNRQVNCETANLQKTVDAAVRQSHLAQTLMDKVGESSLPPKLREACERRLAHPKASLSELAVIFLKRCARPDFVMPQMTASSERLAFG